MTQTDEPTYPFPPRYWWLKRIIAASLLLIAAFAGLIWWWSYEAHRRMQAEVDAIHARGEPILIEDFAHARVPDARNAAVTFKAASAALVLPAAEDAFLNIVQIGSQLSDPDRALLDSVRSRSAPARSLARKARFQSRTDWNVTITTPVMAVNLPNLSGQRRVARTLAASAWSEHLAGRHAESLETCLDMLRHADAMQEPPHWLVNHLVGVAISTMTTNVVRVVSYDLNMEAASDATTRPDGPASREQVKRLIAALLDEKALRDGWKSAMHGERLGQRDAVITTTGTRGLIPIAMSGPMAVFRPAFILDGVRMIRMTTRIADAAAEPTFEPARKHLPDDRDFYHRTLLTSLTRIMSRLMFPATSNALRSHYRARAERRIAALRLGIRLYQVDHGVYPKSLGELVPEYLPLLPADPFAQDERPFGYITSPEPLLYSVGTDGKDENGSTTLLKPLGSTPTDPPPGHPDDPKLWERADVIFKLEKPAPLPAPTTTED